MELFRAKPDRFSPEKINAVFAIMRDLVLASEAPTDKVHIRPYILTSQIPDLSDMEALEILFFCWRQKLLRIFAEFICPETGEKLPREELREPSDLGKTVQGCMRCGQRHHFTLEDATLYFFLIPSTFSEAET